VFGDVLTSIQMTPDTLVVYQLFFYLMDSPIYTWTVMFSRMIINQMFRIHAWALGGEKYLIRFC